MASKGKCSVDKKNRELFLKENGFSFHRAPSGGSSHSTWRHELTGYCITVCASPANGTWREITKVVEAHEKITEAVLDMQDHSTRAFREMGTDIGAVVKNYMHQILDTSPAAVVQMVTDMQKEFAQKAERAAMRQLDNLRRAWMKSCKHALKLGQDTPSMPREVKAWSPQSTPSGLH